MRRIVLLCAGGHYGRGRTSGASAVEESIVRAALVDKCLGGDIVLILGAQLIGLALAANYYLENQPITLNIALNLILLTYLYT